MSYSNNDPRTGPALVTYNAKKHQALDDISIPMKAVTSPIVTALDGEITKSILRHEVTANYTPDGRWTADMKGVLFPYLSHRRGQNCELSGTTDTPLRFDGIDGQYDSILRAVLTQMPAINFAVDKPMFGACTWEGLCARGKDPKDAASYYSQSLTSSSVTDASFDPADLVRGNFTLDFGSVTGIEAESGWVLTPQLNVQRIIVAGVLRKIVFESLTAMITGTPANIDPDDLLAELKLQNDAAIVPGRSARALGAALSIKLGATTYLYAPSATPLDGGSEYGAAKLRNGQIAITLNRSFTTGAPAALWSWTAPA